MKWISKNASSVLMILSIVILIITVGVLNSSFQKELAKKDIQIQEAKKPSQIEKDNRSLLNHIETRTKLITVINESSLMRDKVEVKIRCYRDKISEQKDTDCEKK